VPRRPRADPDSPDALGHGTITIAADDPGTLYLNGEIDLNATRRFRTTYSPEDLRAVDLVDLSGVSFADSGVISVVAVVLLERPADRPRLRIRGATEMLTFVLGVSGISPQVDFE